MKITELVEREICDICRTDHAWPRGCKNCDKAICYKCQEQHTVEYPRSVHFNSSEDYRLCLDCNTALIAKPTPLFTAFKAMGQLRAEYKAWATDFDKYRSKVEEF